jgi:DNA-binding NarL/FixJ family response regulator
MTDNLICLCGIRRSRPEAHLDMDVCTPVLSQLEANVLCLLARGRENSDIARELGVSEHAVKEHIKALFYKARARSNPQLLATPREQVRSL